jgi:DNA-binding CsgD family transcriptional regulator
LRIEALGRLARLQDDPVRTTAMLREAADLAESHLPPERAVRPLLDYADTLSTRVRIRLAHDVVERAARLAEMAGQPALLSEVRGWRGLVAAMAGQHAAAETHISASLQIAIDHDLPEQAALAYRRRANIAEYCSDYSAEVSSHRHAIHFCRENQTGDVVTCLSCMAYACFRKGDWKEALASAKAVLEDGRPHPALASSAACVAGLVAAYRGQRRIADAQLTHALAGIRRHGLVGMEFFALAGLGWLHQLDGDAPAATRCFDELRALWRETDDLHDAVQGLLFAGGHYARIADSGRLADCIDILMTIMRHNPLDEARAALLALKGAQARLEDRQDGCGAAMAAASNLFAKAGLPLEQVWTGCEAAALGDHETRARCLAVARRLGLRPLLARLEEPCDQAGEAPCDLPPRLREVLQLLAEGLTSKEIADRLALSTRTVEMHVGRLLKRLNCRTRPEAVRVASERGWIS